MVSLRVAICSAVVAGLVACGEAPPVVEPDDAGAAGGGTVSSAGGGAETSAGGGEQSSAGGGTQSSAGGGQQSGSGGGTQSGTGGGTSSPDAGQQPAPVACDPAAPSFDYDAGNVSGRAPGTLVRCQAVGGTSFPDHDAYRVLYTTTVVRHDDAGTSTTVVAASGLALVPKAAPATQRAVLANTHGTTGMVPGCAPSVYTGFDRSVFLTALAPVAPNALVVVPDFVGLGADPGVRSYWASEQVRHPWTQQLVRPLRNVSHPYPSLEGEGRATIDLVRAARALPDARTGASPRWLVGGVSQGGHAALATGEVWTRGYGAETQLVGVIAGAPGNSLDDPRWIVPEIRRIQITMTFAGLSLEHRDLNPADWLTDQALAAFGDTAGARCLGTNTILQWMSTYTGYIGGGNTQRADPATSPAVVSVLRANSPGHQRTAVPLFIGQVTDDPFVDHRRTRDLLLPLERQTNPASVTACLFTGDNPGQPWLQQASNHDAFSFMFGARAATGSCTGPDGGMVSDTALAFATRCFGP